MQAGSKPSRSACRTCRNPASRRPGRRAECRSRRWGWPRFAFTPRDHVDLGERLGGIDHDAGAHHRALRRLSGPSRACSALTQFMLDVHTTEHGYREVYVPYLVNERSMRKAQPVPNSKRTCSDRAGFFLIPTASAGRNSPDAILSRRLPARYVCHSPCFRSGRFLRQDTRSMIRQPVRESRTGAVVRPADSAAALETLTGHAETILQRLGLAYRVVSLCTGDLGFSAAKTYDLEVWLPRPGALSRDFVVQHRGFPGAAHQGALAQPGNRRPELVHTLNGSGLAVGRARSRCWRISARGRQRQRARRCALHGGWSDWCRSG